MAGVDRARARARSKGWYARNRDRVLAAARVWRKAHAEAERDRNRRYRASHRQVARAYYLRRRAAFIECARRRYQEKPDVIWAANIKRLYGLTQDDYERMLRAQGGVCAVCKGPQLGRRRRLHVDHDHRTGRVRALLCQNCNVALGCASDDPERLLALAIYAETWRRVLSHEEGCHAVL